jgi:hypothetical protein
MTSHCTKQADGALAGTPHSPRDRPLPPAIRQRLWDQLWTRLLAPAVDPADKVPVPAPRDGQEGGPR